jgi:pyruvate,water dikinase
MEVLQEGQDVTLSCAGGEVGAIYEGHVPFRHRHIDLDSFKRTKTLLMINLATPETAYRWWNMPVDGVGLARIEFIITDRIGIHPMAAAHPDQIEPAELERWIRSQSLEPGELAMGGIAAEDLDAQTEGALPFDPRSVDIARIFTERLASGIARIASSQHPRPVIVRTSDFKSNEYAQLAGGRRFEPEEEGNPMLGWRGASRYASDAYRDGFALECRAIRMVREEMGLDNVIVMVPFCRTPEEASRTLDEMKRHGLRRGRDGLKVYMMCEIPANVLMLEAFDPYFDGY